MPPSPDILFHAKVLVELAFLLSKIVGNGANGELGVQQQRNATCRRLKAITALTLLLVTVSAVMKPEVRPKTATPARNVGKLSGVNGLMLPLFDAAFEWTVLSNRTARVTGGTIVVS